MTLAVYANWLCNRLLAPTCTMHLWLDEDCGRFVHETFDGRIGQAYERITIGAGRADFWRTLVLQTHGGYYLDLDANLVWPAGRLTRPEDHELFIIDRKGLLTNFFLASAPNNDNLARLIDTIVDNIEDGSHRSVYSMTGPVVYQQVLDPQSANIRSFRMVCHQGQFMNPAMQYPERNRTKWSQEEKERPVLRDPM